MCSNDSWMKPMNKINIARRFAKNRPELDYWTGKLQDLGSRSSRAFY